MTWVKLDDAFFRHPKAIAAGPLGRALFLASCCHASHGLTDGHVSRDALPMLLAESGAKKSDVTRLINAGLWRDVPGGFEIHDYLDRNPDAESVRTQRDARARAGQIGGRRSKPPSKKEASASGSASPGVPAMSEANGKQNGTPVPYPVPPDVVSSSELALPPDRQPVDDDEPLAEPQPIDPVSIKVRAVLERCTDARIAKTASTPANPQAYRTKVLADLQHEHAADLRTTIRRHPLAPIDVLAGHVLGEQNSLYRYREDIA